MIFCLYYFLSTLARTSIINNSKYCHLIFYYCKYISVLFRTLSQLISKMEAGRKSALLKEDDKRDVYVVMCVIYACVMYASNGTLLCTWQSNVPLEAVEVVVMCY